MSLVSSPFFLAKGVTADEAGQSLRFEDGDSAYLSWTPASAGNRKTWTWSGWVKLGNIGTTQWLFAAATSTADYSIIRINSTNTVEYARVVSSALNAQKISSNILRDPSAWYHIVVSEDCTGSVAQIYVNGSEVSYGTNNNPTNVDGAINNTGSHIISGPLSGIGSGYVDGYLANVCFIDGQALDPTSFGEYDDTLWRPKSDADITGNLTFGTNGFYLPFKQTTEAEGFSTVTYTGNGGTQSIEGVGFEPDLIWGKRRNSTNSHWLVDSVRGAGKRIISNSTVAEDTPTGLQSSFDSNGFTVGSNTECNASGSPYVAWSWDAGDNLAPTGFSAVTYTGNGGTQSISGLGFEPDLVWIKNRGAAYSHMIYDSIRGAGNYLESDSTDAEASGSHLISLDSNGFTVGAGSSSNRTNFSGNTYVGWAWDAGSGSPVSNTDGSITSSVKANTAKGFSIVSYTGTGTAGTIGHGLTSAPEFMIIKNRDAAYNWPTYHKDYTSAAYSVYLDLNNGEGTSSTVAKFFDSTAPTSSVFSVGASQSYTNSSGNDFICYAFHSVTGYSKIDSYTGTGTADLAVTGLGFRPAMVIIRRIDSGDRWLISDSTRSPLGDTEGTNIFLDAPNAESGSSTTAMTFDSDGFTLNGTNGMINASGGTYVYIAFAGGQDLISPVNTDGTITSRVKANTAKGFSITSYVGTGTAGTVGHGLTSAPEIIIVKNRDSATNWPVYTTVVDGTYDFLYLNLTNAAGDASALSTPTSSVFSLGSSSTSNASGKDHIAYCFHSVSGYSSIGSYSGTGASGNSITTGFKPAFVLIKRTDSTGNWVIHDNTRSPVNPINEGLYPNTSDAENTGWDIDFDATGFTLNTTGSWENASGGTYIYMAFADTRDATFFGDISGNGNNWTPNALNNTDVVPDSPVTENNFATLNTIQSSYSNSVTTFSEGNLKAALGNASNWRSAVATQQHSSGKWYYEVYANQGANGFIGFGHDNFDINGAAAYAGSTAGSWGWLVSGELYNNAGSIDTLSTYTTGDIISIALDFDNAKAYWAKNGTWENSADPAAGTGGTSIDADKLYKMGFSNVSGYASTANFGQDSSFAGNATPQGNTDDNGVGDFYYAPPTGFLALTTGNLDTPTITAPDENFNTVLWSGTGAVQSVTGVGFQPDLLWTKARNTTYSHIWYDAVRGLPSGGTNTDLIGDTADKENTYGMLYVNLASFDTDGFTTGTTTSTDVFNTTGTSQASWCWLGNNGTVSNTDGDQTTTISANPTAGFSIGTFTAPSSYINFTTGHGLTAAPEMVILKRRDAGSNWWVWHKDLPNAATGRALKLDTASAEINGAYFDQSNMTATTVGYTAGVFIINGTYVQYIFHSVEGYSKIGSYTGNGSTDGPFVHCGFRPAWIMVKNSIDAEWWSIMDNTRSPFNMANESLAPNESNSEFSYGGGGFDFLSNGFKLRGNSNGLNGSSDTHIFLAFAEAPFKSANAR